MLTFEWKIKLLMILRLTCLLLLPFWMSAQTFYRGADLSYVNEMQDCGVVYKQEGTDIDPYALFAKEGCQLVRLRLWNNPTWYKDLNSGKMYSNLEDVKKSISRSKQAGMKVLLDFHLSDSWADPQKQLVPASWANVVGNTDVLKDSLYNYIYHTLMGLDEAGLLPEMVQVGNETNRGILLSAADNAKWTMEWPRNAILFNAGLKAVRDAALHSQKQIFSIIHLADPGEASWLAETFNKNGVTDYDAIGLSYYWAWHKPRTIQDCAQTIKSLKQKYNKEIIVLETGYIWTLAGNDQANNIINEVHPSYAPPSHDSQYRWLRDLSKAVEEAGGMGVLYWEPAWVSSPCSTPWGKGSHQENATFFDFNNNAARDGGFRWLREGKVQATTSTKTEPMITFDTTSRSIFYTGHEQAMVNVYAIDGKLIYKTTISPEGSQVLPGNIKGLVIVNLSTKSGINNSITITLP